jgi:hypothetical protein
MPSEPSSSQPRGLPPVTPPSGKFIAQLFLVPGTIVLLAVMLLLTFRYLFGGGYTSEQFLRQLDNPNPDIRWRGASDLAQVLEKPENLPMRADTQFALELTRRLHDALKDLEEDEKAREQEAAQLPEKEKDRVWRKLGHQRKYISFLTTAVARFQAPVAIPVLADLVQRSEGPDLKGATLLRRQGLWAIGILGDNIQNFKKLPAEHQGNILSQLSQEVERNDVRKAGWARTALYYLDPDRLAALSEGKEGVVEVDKVLAHCAQSRDPYTRELVALALRFWEGELVEPTLLKLAQDDGRGELVLITELD